MEQLRYPLGIQTFSTIIDGKYLYVDKTAQVYDIVTRYNYVFLSHPRRFGKSLLISTLEAYFRGEKELFEGLEIADLENDWISFPVFRFDFSPANYVEPQRLLDRLEGSLAKIERQYSIEATGNNPQERFLSLIEAAYLKYNKKVVVLIDEYDKPMLDSLHNSDLHENMKAELRSFFSAIKASDRYIRFAMLTGITKFGKVSIFSGLNNLKDISLIPRYNAVCGISELEFHRYFPTSIASYAEEHNISKDEPWREFREILVCITKSLHRTRYDTDC